MNDAGHDGVRDEVRGVSHLLDRTDKQLARTVCGLSIAVHASGYGLTECPNCRVSCPQGCDAEMATYWGCTPTAHRTPQTTSTWIEDVTTQPYVPNWTCGVCHAAPLIPCDKTHPGHSETVQGPNRVPNGPRPTVTFDGKTYKVRSHKTLIPNLDEMSRFAALQWLCRNTTPRGYSKANPLRGLGSVIVVQ